MSYRFVSFYWYACVLRCVSRYTSCSLPPSLTLILSLLELSSTSVDSAPACPFSLYFFQHLLHVLLVIGCCCSCCPFSPCCCFSYCSCCCCFWINKCHMWLCGLPACPVLSYPVLALLHLRLRPLCGNGNNSRRFALHCLRSVSFVASLLLSPPLLSSSLLYSSSPTLQLVYLQHILHI